MNSSSFAIASPNITGYSDYNVDQSQISNYKYSICAYKGDWINGVRSDWTEEVTPAYDLNPPVFDILTKDNEIFPDSLSVLWNVIENEDLREQYIDYGGGLISIPVYLRNYSIFPTGYKGRYKIKVIGKDYGNNEGKDSIFAIIYKHSTTNITLSIYREYNSRSRKYDGYISYVVPQTGNYSLYVKFNDGNWASSTINVGSLSGSVYIGEIPNNTTVSAFMGKFNGNTLISHSEIETEMFEDIPPEQCPLLYVFNGSEYLLDNSLLPRSEYIEEDYIDIYKLNVKPISDNGKVKFFITQNKDITYIDQILLLSVDHPKGRNVGIVHPDMRIISYVETDANFRAIDNKGTNFTDSVKTRGGGSWKGKNTDWLMVYKKEANEYVMTAYKPGPTPKLTFYSGDIRMYTRINPEDVIIFNIDTMMKYEPIESIIEIDYVNLIRELPDSPVELAFAEIDNMPYEMRISDGNYYKINPYDTLYFSFIEPPKKNQGFERDYFIFVKGYYKKGAKETFTIWKSMGLNDGIKFIRLYGSSFLFESENEKDIRLYEITGREIKGFTIERTRSNNKIRYEIKDIPSGVYFIKIGDNFRKGVIVK